MSAARSTAVLPSTPERTHAGAAIAIVRRHAVFAAILAVGLIIRVLTMIAYPPALFFGDSWGYIGGAFSGHPIAISNLRASGYSALIWLFTLPGREFVQLVAIQHIAGLAIGLLVYMALIRAGVPRLGAAAAAALVLLDGYVITLEQYVMAETLFTLTLLGAALLLAWPALRPGEPSRRSGAWPVLIAGLLVGAAVLQRNEGLFALPSFLAYLLWTRVGWRALVAFILAVAIPVLGYMAWEDARYGSFALTQSSGWTLYGRVAAFADCNGAGIPVAARPLCQTPAERRIDPDSPTWYIFSSDSPAGHLFGGYGKTPGAQEHSNAVLGSFARHILLNQPLDYLGAVGGDVLRYFTPGATQFNDAFSATSLPLAPANEAMVENVRRQFVPQVRPEVRSPASFIRSYRSVVHVPRPILALLALASIAALVLRIGARREVLLLSGAALLLLLGTAATAGFGLRYLLPSVPFLALGGALSIAAFLRRPES